MDERKPEADPRANAPTSLMADPRATVLRLLATEDDARIRAILQSLNPIQAATLVVNAPSVGDRARLLKSMERRQRAETLDHVAPPLFAMLVENPETETDFLLGEVSIERFRELLAMCSPEQRFYWVSRAAMHSDMAAQLLTLLLPPRDLAEMLLTSQEYRKNLHVLRQYEPGQFEGVPVKDRRLRAILQFLGEFDADTYRDVIQASREIIDWENVNREATERFREPDAMPDFERYEAPDPDLAPAGSAPMGTASPEEPAGDGYPDEIAGIAPGEAPTPSNDFTAIAESHLTADRLREIQSDIDSMIHREIVDAGGSFAPEALEQASGRVHCYLHYGMVRLSAGDRSKMARLLAEASMVDIMRSGMEYIEAIRQRALRIRPMSEWFDREQILFLEGMLHPRVGTTPGKTTEYVFWLPSRAKRKEDRPAILVDDARDAIEETAGWTEIARRMPEATVRRALASTYAGAQAYLASLTVAIVLYRRWEPGFCDLQDVYDFRDRNVDETRSRLLEPAREAIAAAAERWSRSSNLDETASSRVNRALLRAGERLSEWLTRYPRPKANQCRDRILLPKSPNVTG